MALLCVTWFWWLQDERHKSNLYEHIRDAKTCHDAQTMDTATESQQQILQRPAEDQEETNDKDVTEDDFDMSKEQHNELKVSFIIDAVIAMSYIWLVIKL